MDSGLNLITTRQKKAKNKLISIKKSEEFFADFWYEKSKEFFAIFCNVIR